jgi:hypothetical protein
MEWDVQEHLYFEKSNDWLASVGIITAALAVLAFMFNNILLMVLIIVAAATIVIVHARKPEMMHVSIGDIGVRAGNTLYPFSSLEGFSVVEHPMEHKIILESNRHFMPHIYIPIADDVDLGEVRRELLKHIQELDLRESMMHMWLERWGF